VLHGIAAHPRRDLLSRMEAAEYFTTLENEHAATRFRQ
jgi:hypothetical protein